MAQISVSRLRLAAAMMGWAASLALPHPALASPFAIPDMEAADSVELTSIAEYSRATEGHEWSVPSFQLALPLTPGLEAAAAFGRRHVHANNIGAFDGWGDGAVAMKWELLPVPEEGGFGITVEPSLAIPMGDGDVSDNDWRAELPVVLGWRTGPLTLHAMLGYSASLSDKGDAVPFGTLVTYDVDERLSLGAELVASAPISDFSDYETDVAAGASYALNDSWAIEGRIARTLRNPAGEKATDFAFAVELSF